jgi:N-acetylated-alpha-linked acidic dipeptidase
MDNNDPVVGDVSSESDHGPFAFRAGVPVMNIRFRNKQHNVSAFPTHHTAYDNVRLYRTIIDPDLDYLETCGKVMAHAVRQVADSLVLPYDVQAYAVSMQRGVTGLRQRIDGSRDMRQQNVTLDYLDEAIARFALRADNWTRSVNGTDFEDPIAVRALNDQGTRN